MEGAVEAKLLRVLDYKSSIDWHSHLSDECESKGSHCVRLPRLVDDGNVPNRSW